MEPEFRAGKTVYYVDSDNFIDEATVVMTIKRSMNNEVLSNE